MFRQSPSTMPDGAEPAARDGRAFRLLRYAWSAAALALALLIAALGYFQWQEQAALQEGQQRQREMVRKAGDLLAQQHDDAARRDLLAVHEAGNVSLVRLLAHALWEHDLAAYFAQAQAAGPEACKAAAPPAAARPGDPLASAQAQARRECAAEVARQLGATREHAALETRLREALKGTAITQARLLDLRGITLAATDPALLGEDRGQQPGWLSAARQGRPHSELLLRNANSAPPRDLIVSNLPLMDPGGTRIAGAVELVSDVTALVDQVQGTASKVKRAADDLAAAQAAAGDFHEQFAQTARTRSAIFWVLLAALLGALVTAVRGTVAQLARRPSDARPLAQRQLAQTEEMAALGQMVAGVAHQLNTPLAFSQNNVRMAADRLRGFELPLKVAARLSALALDSGKDRVRLDISRARAQLLRVQGSELDVSEPLEMLSDTLQGLEQMRELVDNLREFTRPDRSRSTRCDIDKALRNVIYVARGRVPARVQIVERYGSVPPLRCNLSQLNQVFLNLIDNAAQAIDGEGLITVSTRAEGATVIVDVADTGSGIKPEVLPFIFDEHFTTKPAGAGSGLGLPIARGIVREHGGELTAATRVGVGSVFTVRLPSDEPGTSAAPAPLADAAAKPEQLEPLPGNTQTDAATGASAAPSPGAESTAAPVGPRLAPPRETSEHRVA